MNDKEFWLQIRRALMMIVKAIERKYPSKSEVVDLVSTGAVTVAHLPDMPED